MEDDYIAYGLKHNLFCSDEKSWIAASIDKNTKLTADMFNFNILVKKAMKKLFKLVESSKKVFLLHS